MNTLLPALPASYWQLLKASFKLYRAGIRETLLLSFFLAIVAFVPRFLSNTIGQDIFYQLSPFAWHRAWLIVIDLVALIFFIAILWRLNGCLKKKHEPIKEDLNIGFKKFISVAIATLIASLIVSAAAFMIYGLAFFRAHYHLLEQNGFELFIMMLVVFLELILLLYLATLFILIAPVIAIKNKGILGGLAHCVTLSYHHPLRVFTLQLTPWLVYLCVILLIKYGLQIDIHLYFAGNDPHTWVDTLINLILFALFVPWIASLQLLQLYDLESR